MLMKPLLALGLTLSISGCFKIPISSKAQLDSGSEAGAVTDATSTSVSAEKEIATFDPDTTTSVRLTTPKVEGLQGASVTIAPGSLGIAVDLVVEQASELGETSISGEMGLASDIQVSAASPGMIVRPSESVDLKKPLSLAMPLPVGLGFHLQNPGSKYGIFYKYFDPSVQKLVTGLKVVDGTSVKLSYDAASGKDVISFEGYFGAYWAAILSREVAAAEVPAPKGAEEPIINKAKVAVIQNSGIVKETEVVQKEAVPTLVWDKPSLRFISDTRSVVISVATPKNQKVEACKVDLFESATAKSGISLESPLGTSVEVAITNLNKHSLYGRFRCTDSEGRITITPWSDYVVVPAAGTSYSSSPETAVCDNSIEQLNYSTNTTNGDYYNWTQLTRIAKCKYQGKVFLAKGGLKTYITTPAGDYSCGLASHSVNIGDQTLSCERSTSGVLGSNFLSMNRGNYVVTLDFSQSTKAPKLSLALIPCAQGDYYVQTGYSLYQANTPTAADKMTHVGACEYSKTFTSLTDLMELSIRNLDGTFSCGTTGTPQELYYGEYFNNYCASGSFRKFQIKNLAPALSYEFVLKMGESAAAWGQAGSTLFGLKATTTCPEKLYISSSFTGTTPVEGQNVLYRMGSCEYGFQYFADQTNLSQYAFKLKTLDNALSCGGTVSDQNLQLDCSSSAPAINVTSVTGKSYYLNFRGNGIAGTLNTGTWSAQEASCTPGFYLHPDETVGVSNQESKAFAESEACVFEKLWTPTSGKLGFFISDSWNNISGSDGTPSGQPSLNGANIGISSYSSIAYATKIQPTNVVAGTTYKVTIDARRPASANRLKITSYASGDNICSDNLSLQSLELGSGAAELTSSMTYDGACLYHYNIRNDKNITATQQIRVIDNSTGLLCGWLSGSNYLDGERSNGFNCSSNVEPFFITLEPRSSSRLYVKRLSGGLPMSVTRQFLTPGYPDYYVLKELGSTDLPIALKGADYINSSIFEKDFIWSPTSPKSFRFGDTSSSHFCVPSTANVALIGAPMGYRCTWDSLGATSLPSFGPFSAGNYRIRLIKQYSYETAPSIIVEPIYVAPGYPLSRRLSSSSGINQDSTSTSPGSLMEASTWSNADGSILYLFGGMKASGELRNALWSFTVSTQTWTLLAGGLGSNASTSLTSPVTPGARYSSASWYDEANNRLYLFGGVGYDSSGSFGNLNDIWYYDISGQSWNIVGTLTAANDYGLYGTLSSFYSTNRPRARSGAMAFRDSSGYFWLFGGESSSGQYFNDLWKFDPSQGLWAWMGGDQGDLNGQGSANWPSARKNSGTWDLSGSAYMFGGAGSLLANDMWTLNFSSATFVRLQDKLQNGDPTIWENNTFHSENRPPFVQQLYRNVSTWKQGADFLWANINGVYYTYSIGLNSWAIVSRTGSVADDIAGPGWDPYVPQTGLSVTNYPGQRRGAAVWQTPLGAYLYGGITASYYPWDDLWQISP